MYRPLGKLGLRAIETLEFVTGERRTATAVAASLRVLSWTGAQGNMRATRFASRLSYPRGNPVFQVRRLDLNLELDLRDNLQRTLYYTGSYEDAFVRFLRDEVRSGDVYVDVGAHIGIHALTVARRLRACGAGRVVAFEPSPDTAATLQRNVERNGFDNVQVVQAALGPRSDRVHLFSQDPADVGTRSLHGTGGASVFTVEVLPFDRWARTNDLRRLDIAKLDIEGGEFDALLGMQETIARLRPRLITVELVPELLLRAMVPQGQPDALLRDMGYERHPSQFAENVVYRPSVAARLGTKS